MPANRKIEVYDSFSFAVATETDQKLQADDGTPLAEPEDVELHVLVFYDRDPFGTVIERRYRCLPETWEKYKGAVNGGVEIASLVDLPPGVKA